MNWLKKKLPIIVKIHFIFWIIYFSIFWSKALEFDAAGNLFTNHINIWGDWAVHLTMVSKMAYRNLFSLESPLLINHKLSYPFASNFISALLVRAGVPIFNALIIPSFLLSLLTIWAIYYFYQTILKSKKIAILASNLFLFNGGLGFIYFFQDLLKATKPWSIIWSPPQKYTNIEPQLYRFISIINSMIIPQRAFVLGFPLALIALTQIYKYFAKSTKHPPKKPLQLTKLIAPIMILGFMPWLHTHSFLASFIILLFWFLADLFGRNWSQVKIWLILAVGVTLISLPIIKLSFSPNLQADFLQWHPGWYSYNSAENWWIFWLKNWWLVPILSVFGYYLVSKENSSRKQIDKNHHRWLYLPFFIIFALLNLFLFQPFIWDNTKLLVWAAVGFYALTAKSLTFLWNKYHKNWQKIFISFVFTSLILAGALDNFRALRFELNHYQWFSQEELALTEWVKTNTEADSIWLTGTKHNHWLYNLTGRQSLMTYPGWLWTHGYDYWPMKNIQRLMFENPQDNLALFNHYQVDYVVIGPNERRDWKAKNSDFAQNPNFQLIKETAHYQLYTYQPLKTFGLSPKN